MTDTTVLGYANLHTAQLILWLSNDEPTYRRAYRFRVHGSNTIHNTAADAEQLCHHWIPAGAHDFSSNDSAAGTWPEDIDWQQIATHINELGNS